MPITLPIAPDGRRYAVHHEHGDVFERDDDFDGLTVTIELRSDAEEEQVIKALDAQFRTSGQMPAAWRHPDEYGLSDDVVQVLCEVTLPQTASFPRACEMPISSGDHAVGDRFVSIGWRDDEGTWFVAGWDMMQDCWADARCFIVTGWQSLARSEARQEEAA